MAKITWLSYWKSYCVLLVPILLSPLPIISGTETARCAYVLLIMAFYWMMDLLPLAATALIPVALFPLFGILSTNEVCMQYMKNTNMMFVGGLMVAIAIEHCNLHKRIAVTAMGLFGTSPGSLMAGFMIPTAFLSMWISNTATTAMMVPIVDAVLIELAEEAQDESDETNYEAISSEEKQNTSIKAKNYGTIKSEKDIIIEIKQRNAQRRKMMMMAVCYSANIGGTGTTIGTPPNLILLDNLSDYEGQPLTFGSWMLFAVPPMIIANIFVWIWLYIYYLGIKGCCKAGNMSEEESDEKHKTVKKLIKEKYKQLGPFTFHEIMVLNCFLILVIMWFFRHPGFMDGWGDVLESTNNAGAAVILGDATPAIFVAILLFALPSEPNFLTLFSKGKDKKEPSGPLLDWKTMQQKMPWDIIFLLGGGSALAAGSEKSCLSYWIGQQLSALESVPTWLLVIILCIIACALTQVASNTATASIMMPVLLELSLQLETNPLYFLLPTCLVCSYAFMLPVSTGPNAIAFASSGMTTFEMMKLGFIVNIICIGVITLTTNTLGIAVFQVTTFPEWAENIALRNETNFCSPIFH